MKPQGDSPDEAPALCWGLCRGWLAPGPPAPSSLFALVQVVVERYQKEKTLPALSRTKFLVSQDLPLSQFAITLRLFALVQVVVERYQKEKTLPALSRTKFLVSQDLPLSQFAITLRTRLCLASSQTFYLLVNNKGLPNMTVTMQELYRDNKDEDGFLYLTYASQEMFGSCSSGDPVAARL
nr:PREDICTED: microtubule-associated proteins 1A/1B light chain 3C-like [Struthio camelus australis]